KCGTSRFDATICLATASRCFDCSARPRGCAPGSAAWCGVHLVFGGAGGTALASCAAGGGAALAAFGGDGAVWLLLAVLGAASVTAALGSGVVGCSTFRAAGRSLFA